MPCGTSTGENIRRRLGRVWTFPADWCCTVPRGGRAWIGDMQAAERWELERMPGHYAEGQLASRSAVARSRHARR